MTVLALPATVADIIAEYESKNHAIADEIKALDEAFTRLDMAATVQGAYVERVAVKPYLHVDTLRKNLLRSGWQAVYRRLGVESIASAKDKALFERALADPPPLTMDTAKATFGDYLIRPRFHILRGLAEGFCVLDPAYKSHSKVRIGVKGLPKRVVLNNWGGFASTYGRDRFRDMANALAAVRGQPALEWCEMLDIDEQHKQGDAVLDGRVIKRHVIGGPAEEYRAPNRGLTVRKFLNGNAHVFFDKDALLAVNRGLAEFYGEVLPDAEPEGVTPSTSTAVSADLQFYWSSPDVVARALDFAGISGRQGYASHTEPPAYRVLEPSCGDGRILDQLRERGCRSLGIEYHAGRAAQARAKGHAVHHANFLEQPATADFDVVVMNPPFYGRHYVKHVRHALGFLKPNGVLVAILPASARYDHGELDGEWRDLPTASFAEAGTNVPTTMLKIRKSA